MAQRKEKKKECKNFRYLTHIHIQIVLMIRHMHVQESTVPIAVESKKQKQPTIIIIHYRSCLLASICKNCSY